MNDIYLEKTRQLVNEFMSGEDAKIYLFGSRARGDFRRSSDVDIAIEYAGKSNRIKIDDLRDFLEESTIPYRVDVVDMQFASENIIKAIRRDGILWN